jgi:hypothetical protein
MADDDFDRRLAAATARHAAAQPPAAPAPPPRWDPPPSPYRAPPQAPKSGKAWIVPLVVLGLVIAVPIGTYSGWYDQPPKKCSEATASYLNGQIANMPLVKLTSLKILDVVGVKDIAAADSRFMQCEATLVTSSGSMTKLQFGEKEVNGKFYTYVQFVF